VRAKCRSSSRACGVPMARARAHHPEDRRRSGDSRPLGLRTSTSGALRAFGRLRPSARARARGSHRSAGTAEIRGDRSAALDGQGAARRDAPRAARVIRTLHGSASPTGRERSTHPGRGEACRVATREGRCTFVAASGHRCEARHRLEFDHRVPLALGGESTVAGLRLLCRTHNQLEGEIALGSEFMASKRAETRAGRAQDGRRGAASARAAPLEIPSVSACTAP
jgi:hypothetical protein